MKKLILFTLLLFPFFMAFSQEIERVEISGKIVVESSDVEGVAIYNTSSNKGTTTDEEGKFTIKVAENDIIEVRALQFKDFTVNIDKSIIKSKKMTVFLVEKVNTLDEVVILPYDLTGNLVADMESVKTFNPDMDAIYFGIASMDSYEFSDDYKSDVDNIAMRGPGNNIEYQADAIAIVGMLLKPLFNSIKEKRQKKANNKAQMDEESTVLRDYYTNHYIETNFNIPIDKVDEFTLFVENNGLDFSLLKAGKEMQFLEFLTQKSEEFLKAQSGKN